MGKNMPIDYQAQCIYDELTAKWQPWRMLCEKHDISSGSQVKVRETLGMMPGVEICTRVDLSRGDTGEWAGFQSKHWARLNQDSKQAPPDTSSAELICKEEAVKHLRPLIARYGAEVVKSAYLKTIDYLAS